MSDEKPLKVWRIYRDGDKGLYQIKADSVRFEKDLWLPEAADRQGVRFYIGGDLVAGFPDYASVIREDEATQPEDPPVPPFEPGPPPAVSWRNQLATPVRRDLERICAGVPKEDEGAAPGLVRWMALWLDEYERRLS